MIIATSLLLPSVILAHHNAASHYLLDQKITVKGVVTEFRLINPHARIYFDVTNEEGETEPWLAEGNAASVLKRRGWQNDTLTEGQQVTITGSPARDGGNKVDWESIVLEDGTELRGGNTKADQFERQLRDLDQRRRRPETGDQEGSSPDTSRM
jgi:hypothetical protein